MRYKSYLKRGTIGTVIVGIVFFLTGIGFLDDIFDHNQAPDWVRIQIIQFKEYNYKVSVLEVEQQKLYLKAGLSVQQTELALAAFQEKVELGKTKVLGLVKAWKALYQRYTLLQYPLALFILFVMTLWLIVVGIGFLIIFPWARWFVFISLIINYLWAVYVFFYEQERGFILLQYTNEINQVLGSPLLAMKPWYQQQQLINMVMQSFIFCGILIYFVTPSGRYLFREKKKFDIQDILKDIDSSNSAPKKKI